MSNISELNQLKLRWKENRDYDPFFNDGILVESEWEIARPKIMFLLKESYRTSYWYDIAGRPIVVNKDKTNKFWENILRWKYLIQNAYLENIIYEYPELCDIPEYNSGKISDIAYVNISKELGESKSNDKKIIEIATYDSEFLRLQIDLINPQIILCGKTFWAYYTIYKSVSQFTRLSKNIIEHKGRIVIDFNHPGRPGGNQDKKLYKKLSAILSAQDYFKDYRSSKET